MTDRIVPIPNIPAEVPQPVSAVLAPLKQNVEVLAGLTGDKADRAITFGYVKVGDAPDQASDYAAGATPTQAEFDALVNDYKALREQFNYLVALLRGETMGG